jgi:tRNA(Met) C34 N-acetyltransferase TmcA
VGWGGHGFVLDTTVHPDLRRRGVGSRSVCQAASEANEIGIEWLDVDFEPHLLRSYEGCGFRPTEPVS